MIHDRGCTVFQHFTQLISTNCIIVANMIDAWGMCNTLYVEFIVVHYVHLRLYVCKNIDYMDSKMTVKNYKTVVGDVKNVYIR